MKDESGTDAEVPAEPELESAEDDAKAAVSLESVTGAATEPDLGSPSALVALVAGAFGATLEAIALFGYFQRRAEFAPADSSLVIADAVVLFLALLGVALMIKNPRLGSVALGGAGLASFLSDLGGLSTPPRLIPAVLMILSAIITTATRNENSGETPAAHHNDRPKWLPIISTIAFTLHVLGGGYIGVAAGLVAPPLGVVAGWVVWAAILYGGIRLRKTKPWLVLATPFLGIGAWFGLLAAGAALFGWQA